MLSIGSGLTGQRAVGVDVLNVDGKSEVDVLVTRRGLSSRAVVALAGKSISDFNPHCGELSRPLNGHIVHPPELVYV